MNFLNKINYHVTVLSNLIRGFDKYNLTYSKENITESTFKNSFYLLEKKELNIGITKATTLLNKLCLEGDCLMVIETIVKQNELYENKRTGLGSYVKRNWISVHQLYLLQDGDLKAISIEEAIAASYACTLKKRTNYEKIKPRSVSILPIAKGCQAACPFCFSKASVSDEQTQGTYDLKRVSKVFKEAKKRGASRAVITGGGEPGILQKKKLLELIELSRSIYEKVVLISNGYHLGKLSEQKRLEALIELKNAGLTVLAISRHHHKDETNAAIMHLNTQSERIAQTWSANQKKLQGLKLRWICVLQKGGIETQEDIHNYIQWSKTLQVEEICFKELYVSSSIESEYHTKGANEWSRAHQIPLNYVLEALATWKTKATLPWGAPIFSDPESSMNIAAYTEPSLYWEMSNKQCRSWNLMADGRCLASLEDKESLVYEEQAV